MKPDDSKSRRLVIIVGAGSTYSDAYDQNLPVDKRPPLDKGFFKNITDPEDKERVKNINEYMIKFYGLDILDPENDAIENVMRFIYSDLFNISQKENAEGAFQEMLHLYGKRIAETTNNLGPVNQLNLFKIIEYYLSQGFAPENITFVTYNHDLQIEKILEKIAFMGQYRNLMNLDVFPSYYCLSIEKGNITKPKTKKHKSVKIFNVHITKEPAIKLLKMHGSLNWYSLHKDTNANPEKLSQSDRKILLTQRQEIDLNMKVSQQVDQSAPYTLPIIVPPVIHKSEIFHDEIKTLWKHAEDALQCAHEIVIFGYSCSLNDFESVNLLKRAIRKNKNMGFLTVIDPSSEVLKRFVDLLKPNKLQYFPNAGNFIKYHMTRDN